MDGKEMEIFNEMCELAKHIQNHQQIIKAVMDKLSETICYTVSVILLIDEKEIISNVIHPSTKNFLDCSIKMIYENLQEEIKQKNHLENFKKIIYEDTDKINYEKTEFDIIESSYIIPFMVRDRIVGFFGITCGKKGCLSKHDIDMLTIFANQSAILIDNAKLYAQTEQKISEMSILHELGKALSSVLNLDNLLHIIVERSGELVPAGRICILLYDNEKEHFTIKTSKGLPLEIEKNTRIGKNQSITGYVAGKKEPVLVKDICNEKPYCDLRNNGNYVTNSFMSFPFIIHYRVAGVLHVSNKVNELPFDDEEFELLDTFVSQAKVAIENALLYDQMEQMAITDGLTHVYNHRYFQEQLGRELKRATRYKLNISLLMIDIDFFKHFNDKYGHPKGDQILKKVAELIKKSVRNVDIVARYGGEEFVAILPETDFEDAYDAAERIRKKISNEKFCGSNKNEEIDLTVSIGLASYPKNIEKFKDEIIEKADNALYRAKEEGRNKVRAWSPNKTL